MENETSPSEYEILSESEIYSHDHLPLAAAYCRKLGLVELIDAMAPTRMDLRPGLAVQAMVLDTLSGRTPLYKLEDFLAERDVELLLGEDVSPRLFNDNNLARSLDVIFEAGSSNILTEIGARATMAFGLDPSTISYDTTSTSVWGDYPEDEDGQPPPGPHVTYGHSKDHRPDLKQFVTELLCVERGVPIFGGTLDGNSSDKTSNNRLLTRVGGIMAKHGLGPGAFVYVADSAMVTERNLKAIGEKNRFVTRLPASYSACSKLIAQAVEADEWTELGRLLETPGSVKRPGASYKIFESSAELHGVEYRAVVVHSDSHDKRRVKKLEKALAKSEKELKSRLSKVPDIYHCEADAREAARRIEKMSGPLHRVKTNVRSFETRAPGRPPKNGPPPTKIKYEVLREIDEDSAAVERLKAEAGCFALLSNVPKNDEEASADESASADEDALTGEELLKVYKGQYGVESGFAFLKDPLVVNDIFLKKPSRIDALGMILVIALLVWRLMERSLRAWVENTGKTLPGLDRKRTSRPTTFMITTMMRGVKILMTKEKRRILVRGPTERQKELLKALGLDQSAYTNRRCRCDPNIRQKTGSKK